MVIDGCDNSLSAVRRRDDGWAHLATGLASYALGVADEDVRARTRRSRAAAFARQVAMYLAHVGAGLSLARVAAAFGRDRSTVSHACHLIEDRREDPQFDAWIEALEEMMRLAPTPFVGAETAA